MDSEDIYWDYLTLYRERAYYMVYREILWSMLELKELQSYIEEIMRLGKTNVRNNYVWLDHCIDLSGMHSYFRGGGLKMLPNKS